MTNKNWLNELTKSDSDRWIGGVCGGLGEYTRIPSWAWRLIFISLAIFVGTGLLIYILLWIFLPAKSNKHTIIKRRVKVILLLLLAIVYCGGSALFLAAIFNWHYFFNDSINPSDKEIEHAIRQYVLNDAAKDAVLSSHGVNISSLTLSHKVTVKQPIEIFEKVKNIDKGTSTVPYRIRVTYEVAITDDTKYTYREESICHIRPEGITDRGRFIWKVVKTKVIDRNEPAIAADPTTPY